jgi:hypothetical protein
LGAPAVNHQSSLLFFELLLLLLLTRGLQQTPSRYYKYDQPYAA